MKSERFLDAMGYLDNDLLQQAEDHAAPAPTKRRPKRLLTWAACLTLALAVCVSAAFATGLVDQLGYYFGGETAPYLDQILSAVTSTDNGEIQLRVDGAVADDHTCHMVVSLVGLTEEGKEALASGSLEIQNSFRPYAITQDGRQVEPTSWQSGTYTKASGLSKTAKTMLADADMTYLITTYFEDGISIQDLQSVCFAYQRSDGDLTVAVDVQDYIASEYLLTPAQPETSTITDFCISPIGFYFTMPAGASFDLRLIRADGTLVDPEDWDLGYHASAGYADGDVTTTVSGYWCAGSPVAIAILDLADYCGAQVNGETYYFTQPATK